MEFRPQLVLIAAGFDAGRGDPLGGCFLSSSQYAHMTRRLQTLSDSSRVVMCMEGGYNPKQLSM